ncbi:hypothetical protein HHS34_005725 [Acidithiobacillus montserratensis]|uniref:Uncharacterized protein n=1 Tax=Acidithiobacillus montserratensis TaxID=2729135 RepID=A0ACD5HLE2_9PROT|nr:hypothetical protein [Acidithiobacillus montserratensis]MBU2748635.1 hypothetical protein [Acidithiobacillus montserratensis]
MRHFPKYKFAVDADGVLFDFDQSWQFCAEEVLGRPLAVQKPVYALGERYGVTPATVGKIWAGWEAMDGWARMFPRPEGIRTVRMLLDMGHKVTVVTKLPNDLAVDGRRRSLFRHGIGDAGLIAVEGSKSGALSILRPHFFADDTVAHCVEARGTMVPYVARIQAWGDEQPLPSGIEDHPCLESAVRGFFEFCSQV